MNMQEILKMKEGERYTFWIRKTGFLQVQHMTMMKILRCENDFAVLAMVPRGKRKIEELCIKVCSNSGVYPGWLVLDEGYEYEIENQGGCPGLVGV